MWTGRAELGDETEEKWTNTVEYPTRHSPVGVIASADLRTALGRLIRGRGLNTVGIEAQVGVALAREITGDPSRTEVSRSDLAAWIARRSAALPPDLRLAAEAAFGLHPDARHRFLAERLEWLAQRFERDRRTARRRVDEALRLLAEPTSRSASPASPGRDGTEGVPARPELPDAPNDRGPADARGPADGGEPADADGWYVAGVSALIRLDKPVVAVVEDRVIVATTDRLNVVTVAASLPVVGDVTGWDRDLTMDLRYGGRIIGRDRPSASHFRFHIELPAPLRAGERHRFGVGFTVPPGQTMASHYVCYPLVRCADLRIRLRFAPSDAAAARVWLLAGAAPRTVDDDPSGLPRVAVDRAGETQVHFAGLHQGRGYGLRWAIGQEPIPTAAPPRHPQERAEPDVR